jgi:hypothetical protein
MRPKLSVKHPQWFEPVRGFGEWVGFLGGVLALLAVVLVVVLVAIANHVDIRVRNDTGAYVRVSGCVDDAADIEAGETFDAEGVSQHDRLVCRVTPSQGPGRCVVVPVPRSASVTALLSRLPTLRASAC